MHQNVFEIAPSNILVLAKPFSTLLAICAFHHTISSVCLKGTHCCKACSKTAVCFLWKRMPTQGHSHSVDTKCDNLCGGISFSAHHLWRKRRATLRQHFPCLFKAQQVWGYFRSFRKISKKYLLKIWTAFSENSRTASYPCYHENNKLVFNTGNLLARIAHSFRHDLVVHSGIYGVTPPVVSGRSYFSKRGFVNPANTNTCHVFALARFLARLCASGEWRLSSVGADLPPRWADCEIFQSDSSPDRKKLNPVQFWSVDFFKVISPINPDPPM